MPKHKHKEVRKATREVLRKRAAQPGGTRGSFLDDVQAQLSQGSVKTLLPWAVLLYLASKVL